MQPPGLVFVDWLWSMRGRWGKGQPWLPAARVALPLAEMKESAGRSGWGREWED